MKNTILAAFVIMLLSLSTSATSGVDKSWKCQFYAQHKTVNFNPIHSIGIKIELVLGRRSKSCTKIGICDAIITLDIPLNLKPTMSFDVGTNILTLNIPQEYIRENQPEKLEYLTGQTKFIIEEDFVLSQELSTALGVNHALVVKAGTYDLSFNGDSFKIIIGDM